MLRDCDSAFAAINLTADTSIDFPMRQAGQSLSGTWTGVLAFSPATGARQEVAIPQATVIQDGVAVSKVACPVAIPCS